MHGHLLFFLALSGIFISPSRVTTAQEPTKVTAPGKENPEEVKVLEKNFRELKKFGQQVQEMRSKFSMPLPPEGRKKLMDRWQKTRLEYLAKLKSIRADVTAAKKKFPKNLAVCKIHCEFAMADGNHQETLTDLDVISLAEPKNERVAGMRAQILFNLAQFSLGLWEVDRIRKATGKQYLHSGIRIQLLGNLDRWQEAEKEALSSSKLLGSDKVEMPAKQKSQLLGHIKHLLKVSRDYQSFMQAELAARAAAAKKDDNPRVRLVTSKGEILIELFEDHAPNTVSNFIELTLKKFYNGTRFHRVEPGFMVQCGDPNSKDNDPTNDGHGGPGYRFADECKNPNARKHFIGSLSMANTGPNTNGSQFFITHVATYHLNGKHTVFGRVIKGLPLLYKIARGDVLSRIEVVRKRDHKYQVIRLGR